MCTEKLFPERSFYGEGSPENVITDDSSAEREGLKNTWPAANLYLCVFHFLQSMWRWLTCSQNGIVRDERQHLMSLVRKLVYAETERNLNGEYDKLQHDPIVMKYAGFLSHMKVYWERRNQWAVCYRNS